MMLILATMISTNVWAVDPPTLSDLTFPTPVIDENFNDIDITGTTAQISSITTNQTAFGDINHLYNNNSANANSINIYAAGNNMTSKYFSIYKNSGHHVIAQISGGTFSQFGAWRATVEKTSHGYIGLFNTTTDQNAVSYGIASVVIQNNNGTITLQNGSSKSNWASVGSASSNTIDICVIYNISGSAKTYGSSISLPNMRAHVYINGTCINSAGTPTDFTLAQSSTISSFRISLPSGTGEKHMYVDDIKVYNSLPTAGACVAPSSVTVAPTSEAGNYGYRYTTGQDIKLTATATGGSGSYSYQWQKYSGTWDDLDGKTSQNLVISNCTSSDGGQYRCVVSTGATCSLASDGYNVRVWTLNGNYSGSGFIENAITWTGETTGTVTVNLNASSTYDFKVYGNGDGKYYGCNSGISVDASNWTFRTSDGNCSLSTGAIGAGEYTFAINIANADDNNIAVSVTYPRKKIYVVPNGYTDDDAKLSIYYWRSSTNGWSSFLTTGACTDGKYYAEIPGWAQCFSIVRLNSDATVGTFDKKWNQTVDITANASYDQYTVNTWCSGTGCKEGVTAGTFSEPTFTISFAGGSGATGSTDSHTGIVCDANQTLRPNGFSKEGHSFSCWHADVDVKVNGSTVTAGNAIAGGATIQNIHSNIALTAQWNIESYTLTWNLAGGTVTTAGTGAAVNATGSPSSSVAYGSPITVPGVAKEGYNFTGWNTTPLATMPAVNTTYTAQWTIKSYTVTWSVEGTATGTTNVNHGSQVSSLPSTPVSTCDGEFVGWTTSADAVYDKNVTDNYTTTPTVFTNVAGSPTITGDITFYAVFKKRMED